MPTKRLTRAFEGLQRGLAVLTDPRRPEVDRTPRTEVLSSGKLRVLRFQGNPRYPIPVLLVPPLLVRPYIFDLHPGRSLVTYLLERGFDVFLVDFGVPDEEDEGIKLDDYVLDYLPRASEAVREASGTDQLSAVGYCVGGLFSLLYSATAGAEQIRNLGLLAVPVDYRKMGLISTLVQAAHKEIDFAMEHIGNIPGSLPALGMQLANPVAAVARYADLLTNVLNEEFVQNWQSLSTWMKEFIPGPKEAYREFFNEYVVENSLLEGVAEVGSRPVDLKSLRCSLLAVSGESDPIATPDSVRAILDLVGSPDRELALVPGGHIGVIAGGRARQYSWRRLGDWLATRSGEARPRPAEPDDPAR